MAFSFSLTLKKSCLESHDISFPTHFLFLMFSNNLLPTLLISWGVVSNHIILSKWLLLNILTIYLHMYICKLSLYFSILPVSPNTSTYSHCPSLGFILALPVIVFIMSTRLHQSHLFCFSYHIHFIKEFYWLYQYNATYPGTSISASTILVQPSCFTQDCGTRHLITLSAFCQFLTVHYQ
jgi:hypothetical protein